MTGIIKSWNDEKGYFINMKQHLPQRFKDLTRVIKNREISPILVYGSNPTPSITTKPTA